MSDKRIRQRGLWFEEMQLGTVYEHRPGRTITEADNTLFTTQTMNTQALHLDAAYSETTSFGQRLVNSMFTVSTLVGLSVTQLTQCGLQQRRAGRQVRAAVDRRSSAACGAVGGRKGRQGNGQAL